MASKIIRHIPNAITCCNLLCGSAATLLAFGSRLTGEYQKALLLIVAGAVFDFFDGLTARALHVSGPMGKELDSLADVVTFGLAPAAMCVSLLAECASLHGVTTEVCAVPLIMVAFSALRLAKFNIDSRQTTSFIGLPTPANALFWGGLIVGSHDELVASPWALWVLMALCLIFSVLLVAEVPMFSLKFHDIHWQGNRVRYVFLLVSVALLAVLGVKGLAAVIGWYIVLSVLTADKKKDTEK